MLQDALDDAAALLSTRVAIVATLALPKRLLELQIRMDELMTGVQMLMIRQKNIAVRKSLAARATRHALVVGGGNTLFLAGVKMLTTPDGVTILSTLLALRGMTRRLSVVAVTIFGVVLGTPSTAGNFIDVMVAQKDDIDKAMAWEANCGCKLHDLILRY